jgi:hypothetical protein
VVEDASADDEADLTGPVPPRVGFTAAVHVTAQQRIAVGVGDGSVRRGGCDPLVEQVSGEHPDPLLADCLRLMREQPGAVVGAQPVTGERGDQLIRPTVGHAEVLPELRLGNGVVPPFDELSDRRRPGVYGIGIPHALARAHARQLGQATPLSCNGGFSDTPSIASATPIGRPAAALRRGRGLRPLAITRWGVPRGVGASGSGGAL